MSNHQLNKPRTHDLIDTVDMSNTLAVSKYLKQFKFPELQAEALSNLMKKNREDMVLQKDAESNLATKADLKAEIQELRVQIAESKLSMIKWQIGTMLILGSYISALLKF